MDPGPIKNLNTGSDTQPWARVSSWTVARWEQVLRTRPDLVPMSRKVYPFKGHGHYELRVAVPGVDGLAQPHQLAALVHRTKHDPDAGRWSGWTRLLGWLDPVGRKQARIAWQIRIRVLDEVVRILTRRAARSAVLGIAEVHDPFMPYPPPVPNAPFKSRPAPPA